MTEQETLDEIFSHNWEEMDPSIKVAVDPYLFEAHGRLSLRAVLQSTRLMLLARKYGDQETEGRAVQVRNLMRANFKEDNKIAMRVAHTIRSQKQLSLGRINAAEDRIKDIRRVLKPLIMRRHNLRRSDLWRGTRYMRIRFA